MSEMGLCTAAREQKVHNDHGDSTPKMDSSLTKETQLAIKFYHF